eukprot:245278_1
MLSLYFQVKRVIQTGVYVFIVFVLLLMIRAVCWRRRHKKHQLRISDRLNEQTKKRILVTWSDIFTFLMLVMYIINGTVATLNTWFIFYPIRNIISCKTIIIFMWLTLQYCRAFLYLVIITRINLAFHDSCYRYSNKIIYTLYFSVLFYAIGFTYFDTYFPYHEMDGSYHETHIYPLKFCNGIYNKRVVLVMLFFDFIFSIVCLYLFIKPLINIIHTTHLLMSDKTIVSSITVTTVSESNGQHITDESPYSRTYHDTLINGVNDNFMSLIVKYTNLSFICMVSTSLGLLILVWFRFTTFITVDNMFICLSIILMCKFYESWYFQICGCFHRFWLFLCTKCCMDINGTVRTVDKSLLSKQNQSDLNGINDDEHTCHSDDERAYLTD